MELFTLDRNFKLQDDIDKFESVLWTERYYGDSDFQLTVEANKSNIQKLARNTKVYLSGSSEVMFIDNLSFDKGLLTVSGGNLMQWMNNRVIRATPAHEDRYWTLTGQPPGTIMVQVIYFMCIAGTYGDGTATPTGIPWAIQQLSKLSIKGYDTSGDNVTIAVPYGPMFDALKEIGQTYDVGQTITLEAVSDTSYSIQYRNYRGVDRTSKSTNPVRFTPQMDSLTDIKEIQSMKGFRNGCYTFAPGNPDGISDLLTRPGIYWTATGRATPRILLPGGPPPFDPTQPILLRDFDVHVMMEMEEDITTDQVGGDPAVLQSILDQRAIKALQGRGVVLAVDGTVVPLNQFQFGRDYNLGDIVEVQGASGLTTSSRVTEYIRAQDNAGERAYPTLAQVQT